MNKGTCCHQMAINILYDAPAQMLGKSPILYERSKECADFVAALPVTWEQTISLSDDINPYLILVRRKGEAFYAAAMTNGISRDIHVDFSFLPDGNWHMEMYKDGINADRNAVDYQRIVTPITNEGKLTIHLAPGGGWVAKICREE